MNFTFRPIDIWPGQHTNPRQRTPFTATYQATLNLLERELEYLKAKNIVVQIALRENDLRNDGMPKANARAPEHPGVILAFDSMHGPLKYATDVYQARWNGDNGEGWKENLRAIALGLEALRKVDRYGITRRGEQYTGWKALSSGLALPEHAALTPEQAAQVLFDLATDASWWGADDSPGFLIDEARSGDPTGNLKAAYRAAAKLHHPDQNDGDSTRFIALEEAWRVLQGEMR